ncbi:hypothetical protein [Lysobacter gummosus]|uniref:hypothetical protein n=1 Tax=Lysobacter gummosus TaxID=262324 RepID=UPI00362AA6CE
MNNANVRRLPSLRISGRADRRQGRSAADLSALQRRAAKRNRGCRRRGRRDAAQRRG